MSYQEGLDELDAEILVELYRQHIEAETSTSPSPFIGNPEKLRSFLERTTVIFDAQHLPLSSFLRRVRINAGLDLENFASLLNIPFNVLEQLETNYSLPWNVPPSSMADVACLFLLHITTLQTLLNNSVEIAFFSGHIKTRESASQPMKEWLAKVELQIEHRQAKNLLAPLPGSAPTSH